MVKRLGVPAGEGRGVCVAGWTPARPGGGACGRDGGHGRGAEARAASRLENGWLHEGLGDTGCSGGDRAGH